MVALLPSLNTKLTFINTEPTAVGLLLSGTMRRGDIVDYARCLLHLFMTTGAGGFMHRSVNALKFMAPFVSCSLPSRSFTTCSIV